jgi:hypothetical protein
VKCPSVTTKVLNQFTPANSEDRLNPKFSFSNSAYGSIGISKVRIDNTNNIEDFDINDVALPIGHIENSNSHHLIKNLDYSSLYKLSAFIGLSVLSYCVYKDEEMRNYLSDKSISGWRLIRLGSEALVKLIGSNQELLSGIIIGSAAIIIIVILYKKIKEYEKTNYKLIAENCVFKADYKLKTSYSESYVDADNEMKELCKVHNISMKTFKTNVYPRIKELLEDYNIIENNMYMDGVMRVIWTFK